MDDVVLDAMWWCLMWGAKTMWACTCFYVPWRLHARVERAVRARRESVNR